MPDLSWDSTTTGFTFFSGSQKLAVATTRHDQGLVNKGVVVMQPIAREHWTIHLTSPSMNIDLLSAILAALPPDADSTPSCRRAV